MRRVFVGSCKFDIDGVPVDLRLTFDDDPQGGGHHLWAHCPNWEGTDYTIDTKALRTSEGYTFKTKPLVATKRGHAVGGDNALSIINLEVDVSGSGPRYKAQGSWDVVHDKPYSFRGTLKEL